MESVKNSGKSAYSSREQIPERYLKGLSKKEREIMIREILDQPNSYNDWEADKEYKKRLKEKGVKPTKPSKYTQAYKEKFGSTSSYEIALQNKAQKTGEDLSTLKEVYKRGLAAWKTGHRPGVTQHQWAMARVNSFVTGGKTRTTADKDLTKMDRVKVAKSFDKVLNYFRQAQMDGHKIKQDWGTVLQDMARKNKERITVDAVAKKSAPIKKEASIASKLFKAFPNSKTLKKITRKQLNKYDKAGKRGHSRIVQRDIDFARSKRPQAPSAPGGDAPLMLGPGKSNRGGSAIVKSDSNGIMKNQANNTNKNINALKGGNRDLYMLAGGAALAGAGGYALGSSYKDND